MSNSEVEPVDSVGSRSGSASATPGASAAADPPREIFEVCPVDDESTVNNLADSSAADDAPVDDDSSAASTTSVQGPVQGPVSPGQTLTPVAPQGGAGSVAQSSPDDETSSSDEASAAPSANQIPTTLPDTTLPAATEPEASESAPSAPAPAPARPTISSGQAVEELQQATGYREQLSQPGTSIRMVEGWRPVRQQRVDEKQQQLADALALDRLGEAGSTEVSESRDLWTEQTETLLATDVGPSAQVSYEQAVVDSKEIALSTAPSTLSEAQWQRIGRTWDAQRQQWLFEETIAGKGGAIAENGQYTDPEVEARRQLSQASWNKVSQAFSNEFQVVADQQPQGSDVDAALQSYRDELLDAPLTPEYRARILNAALEAAAPVGDVAEAVNERADLAASIVNNAVRDLGPVQAFDALLGVKDGLRANPLAIEGLAADDPLVQSMVLEALGERIRPAQQQMADAAAGDLAALAALETRGASDEARLAVVVSDRLLRYAEGLPIDLVPALVSESQASWAPAIDLLGRYAIRADSNNEPRRDQPPPAVSTEVFSSITRSFSAVGEVLAQAAEGDAALSAMAGEFAEAVPVGAVGAFRGAFGPQGVGQGGGSNLAVETLNQLAAAGDRDLEARGLIAGLHDGYDSWVRRANETVQEFSNNRSVLIELASSWPGAVAFDNDGTLLDPNNPRTLELNDALREFLDNNPDVVARDVAALQQIDADGVYLLRQSLAMAGLSDAALTLDGAEAIDQPIADYLGEHNQTDRVTRGDLYTQMPGTQAEMSRLIAGVADWQQHAEQAGLLEPDQSWAEQLAATQGLMSVARNVRFLYLEGTHGANGWARRTPGDFGSAGRKTIGSGYFAVAAASAFIDATGNGNPELDGWDRAIAAVKGVNYSWLGMRDVVELGMVLSRESSFARLHSALGLGDDKLQRLQQRLSQIYQATGPENKVYPTGATFPKWAQNLSRAGFVATDTASLVKSFVDDRNGMVIAGGFTSLAGSLALSSEAFLLTRGPATLASAARLGIPGATLWLIGASIQYQGGRIERSNTFETADHRRFLAHYGTRDDNGNLKPVTPETEVSNFVDHDPTVRTVADGAPSGGDIVYSGLLSANAVDELLNYTGSASEPTSGVSALNQLAAESGIKAERFYQWYDALRPDQQKTLAAVAGGVDPAAVDPAVDSSAMTDLVARWNDRYRYLPLSLGAVEQYVDQTGLTQQAAASRALQLRTDGQGLRVLLGLERPSERYPEPSAAARAQAEQLLGGDWKPGATADLGLWMRLNGFPDLPAASPSEPPGAPPTQATAYVVQPGDTLWDLSGQSDDFVLLPRLPQFIEELNALNPGDKVDFGAFDPTGDAPAVASADEPTWRDPNLIIVGETVYLRYPLA